MMPHLRDLIADELRRNDQAGPGPVSDGEYLADADAILRIVRDFRADQEGWRPADRDSIRELETVVRAARDKAHWLAVHRRMRMARHMESLLDAVYQMAVDLGGRHQRKEHL
jgi:hypothetical protein